MYTMKYITWRNPAADFVGLQRDAHGIRHGLISRGITDEDIMRHGLEIPCSADFPKKDSRGF
jgi:hypothetical protein